tara:strand:- start:528 stop:1037 length:510 start_codon:yes stop_codon:yes gene_type:complete
MSSRKGGNKARADLNRGQQQLRANEPQGGDLVNKSRTKISNFAKQEQKASMELLKSKDLNNFKNKVGSEVMEDLKKRRYINPATRKTYTEKEYEELVMRRAGERLTFAFEKLEKGGNPARQVIRQDPDIVKVYLKSGREISPVQGRPDQLVEYQKGLTRGIGRGRERGD